MKKILLFTDALCSGGAQRQLTQLAALLKKAGYDVRMLDYWDKTFFDDYLNENGIPFDHKLTKGFANILRMFLSYVGDYKPDVVISYLINPNIICCIAKVLSKHKFKLIVSERNTTQRIDIKEKFRFILCRVADYIVPNSHTQYNYIKKNYSYLIKKTRVITNFIDIDKFCSPVHRVPNQKFTFIIVGRIVNQKNVIRFIDAVKLLKEKRADFIVEWYGTPHPESYYQNCLQKIKEYGLNDTLFFYPPTTDIVNKYQTADCFVLPSIYEGFPNVLCEAMSCGLPVIASNVCDNPFIMSDKNNGFLFNPYDVSEISERMEEMLQMKYDDLLGMGAKSRNIILKNFSKDEFLNNYLQLI